MPLLRHSQSFTPPESAAESNSATPMQFSPSQLPQLLAGIGEEESANITAHILPHLQRLLCCPLCHDVLLDDPVVVETCGHAFCYDCINTAIEEGCYEAFPDNEKSENDQVNYSKTKDSDKEGHKGGGGEKNNERKRPRALGRTKRHEKPRKRKLQFTCPVCFGPAFKWTLVRIPFIRDVAMEAMSHPVLADAIRQDPDSVSLDKTELHGSRLPSGTKTGTMSPPNVSDGELSFMTADVSHTLDTSVTKGLNTPDAVRSGAPPMTSCSYIMDSQQQSMVIIPIPCLPARMEENANVASSEHGEDSIISGVNNEAVPHSINNTMNCNSRQNHSRANSSSSSTVISADLQGGLTIEDKSNENEVKQDCPVNSPVPLNSSEQHPPQGEEFSESSTLQVETGLVLGEATDEDRKNVARALQLSATDSEEQEQLGEEKPLPQAPSNDDISLMGTVAANSWQGKASTTSLASSPHLLLDASVPLEAYVDSLLLSATRLFGAVVNFDERVGHGKAKSGPLQVLPLHTIVRSFNYRNRKKSETFPPAPLLHWVELHYASAPMRCTHCIAGFSLERDGTIAFATTPAIGSALVTGAVVAAWTWLADSVAAGRLLSAAPYTAGGAGAAPRALSGPRPGQWVTEGFGFLVLPDDQLDQLLCGRAYTAEPAGRITGGFENESWRRLVMLSGGVWLRLSDKCLGALVEQAMCTQETSDKRIVQEMANKNADTNEEALWLAECCPDRTGNFSLHKIVVLRGSVPVGKLTDVNEHRISKFVVLLSELFDVAKTDTQESTDSLSRVQFGRKGDHGNGLTRVPFTSTQFACPSGDTDENRTDMRVEMRSCQWLLKNIKENRRTAGVRKQHQSDDDFRRATMFAEGATFQQLLYDV